MVELANLLDGVRGLITCQTNSLSSYTRVTLISKFALDTVIFIVLFFSVFIAVLQAAEYPSGAGGPGGV